MSDLNYQEKGNRRSDGTNQPPQPISLGSESNARRGEADQEQTRCESRLSQNQLDNDLVRWTRGLASWTRILAIFTGALVIAAVLQYCTMQGQLNEMQSARKDSDNATASQIAAMKSQTTALQNQLAEIRIQSAIQRAETKAVIGLTIQRNLNPNFAEVTPIWTNIGKSDATHFRGWESIATFHLSSDAQKNTDLVNSFNFKKPPNDFPPSGEGDTMVQGESTTFATRRIPISDVIAYIDHQELQVIYGYAEYFDIFRTFYTVRFCYALAFERQANGGIVMSLPVRLPIFPPCNGRIEKDARVAEPTK